MSTKTPDPFILPFILPDGPWMKVVAKELTAYDGFLNGKKYILMDRDSKFTAEFRQIIEDAGTECVLLPPKSPNCNSQIERFFGRFAESVSTA